jgi:hypothetical protein
MSFEDKANMHTASQFIVSVLFGMLLLSSCHIVNASRNDSMVNQYGKPISYQREKPIYFPDFSIIFKGTRHVGVGQSPYPRGFVLYDFQVILSDGKEQNIQWSAGTGDIGPVRFKVGGKYYLLERHITVGGIRIKENELVISVDKNSHILPISKSNIEVLLADKKKVFYSVRAIPHFENKAINGAKILYVEKGSFFDLFHLKKGDILLDAKHDGVSNRSYRGILKAGVEMAKERQREQTGWGPVALVISGFIEVVQEAMVSNARKVTIYVKRGEIEEALTFKLVEDFPGEVDRS